MSYNKGKNYQKKLNKLNQSNHNKSLSREEKVRITMGNPNSKKWSKPDEGLSREEIQQFFLEGELEFMKVIKSMKKRSFLMTLLELSRKEPINYSRVVQYFLFEPYRKLGNKSKVWFNEFYEFVSNLPLNSNRSNEILPLYRVMTKSEFMKTLDEGVQNPSWTLELVDSITFLKKNLLTMDENIVLIKSIFSSSEVCYLPEDRTELESEVWVRKGSKSKRTFVVGEYTKEQLLTGYETTEDVKEKLSKLGHLISGSNGFGDEETWGELESSMSSSHDDVIYKLIDSDLPKLVRKMKRDRFMGSLGKVGSHLQNRVDEHIHVWKEELESLTPLTV